MTTALLNTKLQTPLLRTDWVVRRRLIAQIEDGLAQRRKLTVVAAPAGFGKTTLILDWLAAKPRPHAWVTLDEQDNDLYRFWRYGIAALQRVDPAIGESVLASLETARPAAETLVTALINDLVMSGIFDDEDDRDDVIVLVLDDYHFIESSVIHSSVNFLLDNLPAQLHVVLTTRADPPLNLARRRARLTLTEIRAADLRFAEDEAAAYFNQAMHLNLTPTEIQVLEKRTEGWIVGLQLAALSLREQADRHAFVHALAGDDRYIGDYLIEEVLNQQPPAVQDFLLKTSILERFNAALCCAVTGVDESAQILEELDRGHLFVTPLDRGRRWFRYHRLFADLLQHQLHLKSNGHTAELQHRAVAWYAENDFAEEAVRIALAIPDHALAADLIERFALSMRNERGIAMPEAWMQALPDAIYADRPMLAAIRAEALLYVPDIQALSDAATWLNRAAEILDQKQDDSIETRQTRGYVAGLRAIYSVHSGQTPSQMIDSIDRALELLPDTHWARSKRASMLVSQGLARISTDEIALAEATLSRAIVQSGKIGAHCAQILAVYGLFLIERGRGDLTKAEEMTRSLLTQLSDRADRVPAIGALYLQLGMIQLERNELDTAQANLEFGLAQIPLSGEYGIEMNGLSTLARLHLARGNAESAARPLDQIRRVIKNISQLVGDDYLLLLHTRFWPWTLLSDAQIAEAMELADHVLAAPPPPSPSLLGQPRADYVRLLAAVRVRLHQHRSGQNILLTPLVALLLPHQAMAQQAGWTSRVVEVAIHLALLHHAQDNTAAALAALEPALVHAAVQRSLRPLLDEGEPMRQLLQSAVARGVHPERARQILEQFPAAEQAATPPPTQSPLIEPLNDREEAILRLLAQKRSRQEIADDLILSINTVKWHINNLYAKLGVEKRNEAILRAGELGIL
ncbi:hypothetical protein GC175_26270 [bacterium]|nr:hypothetical protein [bacterium]